MLILVCPKVRYRMLTILKCCVAYWRHVCWDLPSSFPNLVGHEPLPERQHEEVFGEWLGSKPWVSHKNPMFACELTHTRGMNSDPTNFQGSGLQGSYTYIGDCPICFSVAIERTSLTAWQIGPHQPGTATLPDARRPTTSTRRPDFRDQRPEPMEPMEEHGWTKPVKTISFFQTDLGSTNQNPVHFGSLRFERTRHDKAVEDGKRPARAGTQTMHETGLFADHLGWLKRGQSRPWNSSRPFKEF